MTVSLIVLADGVAIASGLQRYELIRRTYAWQAPMSVRPCAASTCSLLAGASAIREDASLQHLQRLRTRRRAAANQQPHAHQHQSAAVPITAFWCCSSGVAVLAGLAGAQIISERRRSCDVAARIEQRS